VIWKSHRPQNGSLAFSIRLDCCALATKQRVLQHNFLKAEVWRTLGGCPHSTWLC